MIIQTTNQCTPQEEERIIEEVIKLRYKPARVATQFGQYIVCVGSADFDIRKIGNLPGVRDIHMVKDQSKLVSRQWKVKATEIPLGDGVTISGNQFSLAMGPCSIENEDQVGEMVSFLKSEDVKIMRGGVFKPRSSPYAFRGLGLEGLKMFYGLCREAGIRVVTEVMQVSQVAEMHDYVDVFQVGTRNAQNFNLLDELGKVDKPVLLKRGMSSTLDELLASAEYIFSNGNEKIILCERGVRTFEKAYRNTLDLNSIPYLKEKSHLPVFSDPSHGVGLRAYVETMALASVMAGADGLIMEIHRQPERAMSDGQQSLSFPEARRCIRKVRETVNFRKGLAKLDDLI